MVNLNPATWTGTFALPSIKDIRWRAFGLLFFYLVLGMTTLGFSRPPLHIFTLIIAGAALDMVLSGLLKSRKIFPLSAMISCCSLAIILNWSHGMHYLWLPVFVCIASKYLITLNGKHFFNPSLFAICFCLIIGNEFVTLAPAYQWYGSLEAAGLVGFFVVTGALFLFVFKINRNWLIGSFLVVYTIQTLYRAHVMEHIIPWETLVIGSLTSPAFYLFTFYMITDPATSPDKRSHQIVVGASIALFDLLFHLKFSLYTFFFAGLTVASLRYVYLLITKFRLHPEWSMLGALKRKISLVGVLTVFFVPVLLSFKSTGESSLTRHDLFELEPVSSSQSGLDFAPSNILKETDPRLAHVAKWILSIGDAAAIADVNLDGLPDLFLTQPLKDLPWRAKLYLNKGDLQFEKVVIPELENYLNDPRQNGLPAFAFFLDYDNDQDKDLFVGFAFGKSMLFENGMIPDGKLVFKEVSVPFLKNQHSICLAANAFDYNNDGVLDILFSNAIQTHFPGYSGRTEPVNIFNLPEPSYPGDQRMFQFMHESWHNANNGGLNFLLKGTGDSTAFEVIDSESNGLVETRWSLAVGTMDINDDGFTDLYIANDFGRDDCYLNVGGTYFERQQGSFYGEIGLDTYKGMNVSIADWDGNSKEDIYVSNVHHAMQAEGSLLWMNFTASNASKVDLKDQATKRNALNTNRFGWGAAAGDLNLDGWVDIVQANGMVDASWDQKFDKPKDYWYYQAQIARTGPEVHSFANRWADIRGCYIYPNEPDRVMINNHGKDFVDVAEKLEFNHTSNTRGVALADLDNDGDLDILITDQFGAPILYKNKVVEHQWLGLTLIGNGRTTNSDAVGTKVWLTYTLNGQEQQQYKEVRLVNGFSAMGDTRLSFGLGNDTNHVDDLKVTVQWHNGEKVEMPVPDFNKYMKIYQDEIERKPE